MTPDDRIPALLALGFIVVFTLISYALVEAIIDIYASRPVVTKDPHTGKLHIPRSDLTVGTRRRRHTR